MPGLMPHPRKLAEMGRGGDTEVGHLTEGEVVVPPELAGNSDVRAQLLEAFDRAGIDIGRYTVGGEDDSRNPRTGMREYRGRGAENEGDDRGAGGGGPGSGGGGGGDGGGDGGGYSSGGDHHGAGAVSSSPAASAAGPGPGGGGERGREGGMYGGGGNQSGAPAAGGTGGEGGLPETFEEFIGVTDDSHLFGTQDTQGTLADGGMAFSTNTPPPGLGHKIVSGLLTAMMPGGTFLRAAGLLPNAQDLVAHPDSYSMPRSDEGRGGDGATSSYLPTASGAATDATGAAAAGAAGARQYGYYTPPADPSVPSWQRYLDVSS